MSSFLGAVSPSFSSQTMQHIGFAVCRLFPPAHGRMEIWRFRALPRTQDRMETLPLFRSSFFTHIAG